MKQPQQHPLWKPKFIIVVASITIISIALFTHYISEAIFRDLMIALIGGFIAGSVVENKILKGE